MSRTTWRSIVAVACIAAAAGTVLAGGATAQRPNGSAMVATAGPASAENAFALSLLDRLGGSGNVVFSPYSIDTALAMADAGASGQTAAQIADVLDASSPSAAVGDAAALQRALRSASGPGPQAPTLDLANALWTQSGLTLEPQFVDTLTSDFGAAPQSTDFAGDPAAALAAINAWVATNTGQLIRNMLGPGSVTAQTAFVLANAIYLKARWASPFNAAATAPATFTNAAGQPVRVPFMNQQDTSYGYASGGAYQAVDLPYRSSSLSLLAIMPRAGSLARFQHSLTASALAAIVTSLRVRSVDLSMPKLDLSTQLDLNAPLQRLGMTDAFGPAADFSALTKQRSLNISLVEHAAKLKIDEAGTVAAAATVIVGPTAVAPSQAIHLALNHPYLLLLRDDASGTILFLARVADPSRS